MAPSIALRTGLRAFTSLDVVRAEDGRLRFKSVSMEQLLDAPVLAGRYPHASHSRGTPPAP